MDLFSAVVYYIGTFIVTGACIIAGCFVGAKLRKRKDLKMALEADDKQNR